MEKKFSAEEREAVLARIPAWRWDETRQGIVRGFRFADFADAFAFMTRVAHVAEKLDHHPDWSNSWNTVDIILTTHDAGGFTARDFALAMAIDALAG